MLPPNTRKATRVVTKQLGPGGGFVGGIGGVVEGVVVGGGRVAGGGVLGGMYPVGMRYKRLYCGVSLPAMPSTWENHPVKVSFRCASFVFL